MDKTVAHLNIEHYRRLLTTETDGERRRLLVRLLAEEEAKLPCRKAKAESNARAATAANVSGARPTAPASSRSSSR